MTIGMLPTTTIPSPVHFACSSNVTSFVTPWIVRLPVAVAVTTCPCAGAASNETGDVSSNVAVGNASVSSPIVRIRSSRRDSSLWSCVRSAVTFTVVSVVPSIVSEPSTADVRPTASDGAGRNPSFSRTR